MQLGTSIGNENALAADQFTILLVDDIQANLLSLEEMLQSANRLFLKASNGNEALQIVLKNQNIGLILLDVQMPGMDGYEVAQHLQTNKRTNQIPIVFVTAINKEEQFVLKGFQKGAVDYLSKPLNIKITRAKVDVFERLYFNQKQLNDVIIEKEKINKQLERFMYVISHDLKSPLSGIIALVELLKEDERINQLEGIDDCLDLLSSASTQSIKMISSLLAYSVTTQGPKNLEQVDVQKVIDEVMHILSLTHKFTLHSDNQLPVILTSKIKIYQVFQNLIIHSLESNDKPNPTVHIGVSIKGDKYEFYVRDNGKGIAKEDNKWVFNLFENNGNTNTEEANLLLGLNIAKMNVTEQGGNLWVESALREGSTYFFEWKK